ncbi:MAG TPA: efflux RND transporter permease subunit [Anaerovoracaceae bacterium]|nr:efflux RND transporter permease subunit [Anaerovoracaceae bacterium]
MNISSLAIKRPVATIMLLLMVVVVGFSSLTGIPLDLLPKIEYPVALVMTSYPNASPEEVESMITKPIEQALATVEGLDQLQSVSIEGQSIVVVQFQMDTDMNFATLNMREKVAMVSPLLPAEVTDPTVFKMDMAAAPVVQIYVSGDKSLTELNNEVEDSISTYIERVAGVASVSVVGGIDEEISLKFNQEKLSGYNLSLSQISQILAAENINMPSGDISKGSTKVIVRTIGQFDNINDISNIPIPVADRSVVRLSDIASITKGVKEKTSVSRIDGQTAVAMVVTKQSDANTVSVSNGINDTLKLLEKQYPELTFTVGFDQGDYIRNSISSVSTSAIIGGLLAILIVFLFLNNIRTTLVIAISIPTSLLATFALMKSQGMTLNLITLCAITVSVGMLVDNSIVVLENIFRTRQLVDTAEEAAREGSKEIFLAVIASTLTTVLVFLPIALSNGIAALMFKDFCFTIIIALLASLVVSLTVVPMLSSRMLDKGLSTSYIRFGKKRYKFKYLTKFTAFFEWLKDEYEHYIRLALRKRKKVIIVCILIFVVSISSIALVGTELLPSADEGSFTVSIEMPYGTSLQDKDKISAEVETYIAAIPEISHYAMSIGGASMFSSTDNPSISVTLLKKWERKKSTAQIVNETNEKLSNFVGAKVKVEESSSMSLMLGGSDMTVILKGKELADLENIGDDLISSITKIKGVSMAELDLTEGNPEVKVKIDRSAASYYGVSAYQLANSLKTAINGTTSTRLKVEGNEINIRLSLSDQYTQSVENMKQILITGVTGAQVPVGQIATFEYDNAPNAINRINQERYVNLAINAEGRDLGSVSKDVNNIIDNYNFPKGYSRDTGGQQQEMTDAFSSLALALIVSIALVYLLLAAQFESIILPFIVMMSIPFAMSGAFIAMFLTGTRLSMTSFLGLIMLVGIVVNNAILLIEFISHNKKSMGTHEALVQAGKLRLRPILMTATTTCVGMIPISLGLGEGGEMLAPMAISIIGGMIASTIVTLILIPVLYSVIDEKRILRAAKKAAKDEEIIELERNWFKEDHANEAENNKSAY